MLCDFELDPKSCFFLETKFQVAGTLTDVLTDFNVLYTSIMLLTRNNSNTVLKQQSNIYSNKNINVTFHIF